MEPGGKGRNLPGGRRDFAAPSGASADRSLKFQFECDLEEERHALKEDQKVCRRRAQKYFVETNRRRKALEERWKQEKEKEQRLREQVLQQRKVKLQEATEKFQRAHVPVFQHKKIVQTKAFFQLEEALDQIKGSVLTRGFCLPNRNKTKFRNTDDTSSSSASRNGYFHQKQISAMAGCDKMIQESSRTNTDCNQLLFQKNLKEMQQLLEKQHFSNLENFHQEVKKVASSESLSSLDSLEAGEQNGNYVTPSESSLTTQCDCALYNPEKSQTRNSGLFYTAENTSSKNRHLNNCLRNVESQNNQNNLPIHDPTAKYNVLTPAEHTDNSEEESSVFCRSQQQPTEVSTSDKQESPINNPFTFLKNIKEKNNLSFERASTLSTGDPVFKLSKAWAISGERVQDLIEDHSSEMTPQRRTISVQTSYQPIATSVILFPNQRCSTDIPTTSCSAHISQKDKNISTVFLKNTLGKITETKEENTKCIDNINPGLSVFQDIQNASILCNVKQAKNKEEKGNTIKTVSLLSDTEFNSDIPAQHKNLENNIHERKEAELFKSILKKESKYEHSNFKALDMNRRIRFGTQPVSSLRDSLELAKIKKKNAENEKINQNLGWFDQTHHVIIENKEKCSEENTREISSAQLQCVQTTGNAPKTNLSIAAPTSNSVCTKDHQEYSQIPKPSVNAGESDKACISLNTFMSTGSYFAKQAWMVSKGEEINSPVSISNSKIHEGNQHKNKAKVTRRPRAHSSFMPKNRIGTIIRPQSATEANKILKAREKILAPLPPSTPMPRNRAVENVASPGCQPLHSSNLQTTNTNGNHLNERHVLLEDQVLNRNITENSKSFACTSDLATVMLSTPCSSKSKYKPLTKNICSVNSVQASACQDCSVVTCTKRRPINAENGLHLDHIPRDEKTSTSWQGVHNAIAQKERATGIVPVARQEQVFDSCENKHGAFLERRRQIVASRRWRPTHYTQLSPVPSAFEPVQNMNNTYESDEVSESTVQFLMAEKLAGTSCAEDEILAAMESMQPAKQPLPLNKAQCLGVSALSIEEQKIFQSLDHLDQRLQNVQEAITRNISTSSVLQIITPLNIPAPFVNSTVHSQQNQSASAISRLQLQRRS
ncbi:centrosomal protein of 126 kDa isoform X2 [Dromaius novaehollandiae]|uniref:centrosomal protein of 126 kDa isoform X2 n=1 Tax=Dromaius novaehollandiae TaxID=8790 RepID=UPI0031204BF9